MFGNSGLARYGHKITKKGKNMLWTLEGIKRNPEFIPLICLQACMMFAMPLFALHRLFVTTIDVQMTDYQRFEIPSVPKFFDLRKPRTLKFITLTPLKPAIHLDNRYRLMRHEPMLDADGNRTNVIGEDC
ncbi:uncharacterized protein LOC118648898 [Monomorium pharaonis]|uniref:uncharacterized protein LOC118648898 n=1 Tax=Monomorium pharaonis TaxID=307658 RepID=UPI0017472387|nr:uncharacterized protein LOC118648898 [Monomorium pharaonis]XP_036151327.1 uncharacterized protein LOC118648898 [Monomorium pharaonis]XP_036151328.1 uncharacterized protein LOC118648898 [Monomorium pharaonis]